MNYSAIARKCINQAGIPYSRMHINEVINGRARASRHLINQLAACGIVVGGHRAR